MAVGDDTRDAQALERRLDLLEGALFVVAEQRPDDAFDSHVVVGVRDMPMRISVVGWSRFSS